MNFDWLQLCKESGVPYVEHGPNVSRNNINIKCPYCDDQSEHLGLSTNVQKPAWGCWRCRAGGHSPIRLLCTLLRVSAVRAAEIVAAHNVPSPDAFDSLFDRPPAGAAKHPLRSAPRLPKHVWPLDATRASSRPFLEYLTDTRGFGDLALACAERYDLHYAVAGEQANRIVYPVTMGGKLMAWTGRSRFAEAALRYKADDSGSIKNLIGDWDMINEWSPHLPFVITEGPYDMMKLGMFSQYKIAATCTFGTAFTQAQIGLLAKAARRFDRSWVLYDNAAYMEGAQLADTLSELSGKHVLAKQLPEDCKDPGAMDRHQVMNLTMELMSI